MKRIIMIITIIVVAKSLSAWPETSTYNYYGMDMQEAYDWYWGLISGYDSQNITGIVGYVNSLGNFERWTAPYYDAGYVHSDICAGFSLTGTLGHVAYVVGYKKDNPDKYKGHIFRFEYEPAVGYPTPPYNYVDLTPNLPPPYNNPSVASNTPILSVAVNRSAGWDAYSTIAITGANGMILFSIDDGNHWFSPANRPYVGDESEWYKCTFYDVMSGQTPVFVVIGDNAGIISWTADLGTNWTTQSFNQDYQIPLYGTFNGKLLPLSLSKGTWPNSIVGLSYGNFAWKSGNNLTLYTTDNPPLDPTGHKWWWWSACRFSGSWDPGYPHLAGSDGAIIWYQFGTPNLSHWIKYPAGTMGYTDTTYWFFGMGDGFYGFPTSEWDFYVCGTKGKNYKWLGPPPGGSTTDPNQPTATQPDPCLDFTMIYDPLFGGYRMFWSPPANYEASKVGGYWICPPEGPRWIANQSPKPVYWPSYFLAWPTGQYLDARVIAMRRDGLCGTWTDLFWGCTLDKIVTDNTTGKNNARRLVYGGNKLWAMWQKDNSIYVAASADSGKHWTYRSPVPYVGSGKWPAGGVKTNGEPVVCWMDNIINGSQVTSRLYYSQYSGTDWTSAYMLKEETYTGTGYLYPSISVDQNNHVHIVYEKSYGSNSWQLWYGEFPVGSPQNVAWYTLDSYTGSQDSTILLAPTIGTTKYNVPMVIWNRPNINTLRFAYRDGGGWHIPPMLLTGTMPCIEVMGTTAYLTYVNSGDIWYTTGGTGGFGTPTRICNTTGTSSSPSIANNVIVWQEYVNNDWEIYFSHITPYLGWTAPAKLFGYVALPDRVPQIVWVYPFAFVDWTQGDVNRVVSFNRQLLLGDEGDGIASLAYDLGDSVPSPILVARTGYVKYADEPVKTVDMSSSALKYHLEGLDKGYSWKGRFLLYQESNLPLKCKIKLNGQVCSELIIPPSQLVERAYEIPDEFIQNEEMFVTIEPVGNSNLVLSGMLFYKKPQQQNGGPQSSKEIPSAVALTCLPNPTKDYSTISYALPCPGEVKISIYNSLGQLVRVIDQGIRKAGNHIANWNRKDDADRTVASGIYFLKLETPTKLEVHKIVILE